MTFQLDALSRRRLVGVHPDLVKVVDDAAYNGVFPEGMIFGVSEGLRTLQQQKLDVTMGKSETMHSRHLDGHAVDLVVLQKGVMGDKITWAWPPYYTLAAQMKAASERVKIPVIWGGVWDMRLDELSSDDMQAELTAYLTRAHAKGERGFSDGPHFELPRDVYPDGPPIA